MCVRAMRCDAMRCERAIGAVFGGGGAFGMSPFHDGDVIRTGDPVRGRRVHVHRRGGSLTDVSCYSVFISSFFLFPFPISYDLFAGPHLNFAFLLVRCFFSLMVIPVQVTRREQKRQASATRGMCFFGFNCCFHPLPLLPQA